MRTGTKTKKRKNYRFEYLRMNNSRNGRGGGVKNQQARKKGMGFIGAIKFNCKFMGKRFAQHM